MSVDASALQGELLDAGQAIGLVDGSGSVDPDWFSAPIGRVESVLSDPTQRAALLRALEGLLPSGREATNGTAEHWHPLLGADRNANVYIVVDGDGAGPVTLSAAVAAAGPAANLDDPTKPSARLSVRVPLLRADGGDLSSLAASSDAPIDTELRLTVGLERGVGGAEIGLAAARVSVQIAANAPPRLRIVLEGLDLGDGAVQPEVTLDPEELEGEASHVIVGLLRQALADTDGLAPASLGLAEGLPGVLGLVDGVPPLPVAELLQDTAAFRTWLTALVTPPAGGGDAPVLAWLEHLARLLGVAAPAPAGSGTVADPWHVDLVALGTGAVRVELAVDRDARTGVERLLPGLTVALRPSAAGTRAEVHASAVLAAIPLGGTAAVVPVPFARMVVVTPASGGPLVSTGAATVAAVRGGLTWDAGRGSVTPVLELDGVTFGPLANQDIDLTSAQSVENAAAAAVRALIQGLLGATGPGASLAALLGIDAPAGAAGWPPSLLADLTRLAADPLAEIAAVHRRVLGSAGPNDWGTMLAELGSLLGLTGAPAGTGTADDPWRVAIESDGALEVALAAWNEPDANLDRLRIGLRAGVDSEPVLVAWQCALATFDLRASGAGSARFLGAQRFSAVLSPVPALPSAAGVDISADTFTAALDWTAGSAAHGTAALTGVKVSEDGTTVDLGTIGFPAAAGTIANPLAGLGVPAAAVEDVVRMLALRAATDWGGPAVAVAACLLGLGARLPGLPADWPKLGDPAAPGSLFETPLVALRAWLTQVLTSVSADGSPLATAWAGVLGSLLQGAFSPNLPPPELSAVAGSGTADDPWIVPFDAEGVGSGVEALLWLDPAVPAGWLATAESALAAVLSFDELLDAAAALGRHAPALADALAAIDPGAAAGGLVGLAAWLSSSDGDVPLDAQQPTADGWTAAGPPVSAAPPALPADADAVAQVQAALAAHASTAPVLCLSAPFGSASDWQALVGAPPDPAGHFDFRQPGVPPTGVDLTQVTATGRFYTCDLADDGSGDTGALALQVTRALERVSELHGGGPVAVVAHSTSALAGLAAIQAAPAGTAAALVALGAPLRGSPLTAVLDQGVAEAVRLVAALAPGGLPDAGLQGALDHLRPALDAYLPSAGAGAPPAAYAFPTASFQAPASLSLPAGVPGITVASRLAGDLLGALRTAMQSSAAALPPPLAAGPTHAGLALRTRLVDGGGPDGAAATVAVRLDLGGIELSGAAAGSAPSPRLRIDTVLTGEDGWLVGGPSALSGALPDARVRWAELGIDVEPDGSGVQVKPRFLLHDAGMRSTLANSVALGDPSFDGLLGEVLRALSSPPPAGGPVAAVLDALGSLGIAVPDGAGGVGIAADALAALAADPAGFLGPRLRTALDAGGLVGLSGPAGGPWTSTAAPLPLELRHDGSSWVLRLATADGGLDLGGASLRAEIEAALPALQPAFTVTATAGAVTFKAVRSAGGALSATVDAPPWVSALPIVPRGDGQAQQQAALELVPRLALSSAVSAVLESIVGAGIPIGPVDALLAAPGGWLRRPGALGATGAGGGGFDGARLSTLLTTLGTSAGLPAGPGGTGVQLPGGLVLAVSGNDPLVVSLSATGIGSVLDIDAELAIDRLGHVTPDGKATLHLTLPGGTWGSVAIAAGATPAGLSLGVTPGQGQPIALLPTTTGLEAILGTLGASLLPALLDEALPSLQASPLATPVLELTTALGLSDATGNFGAHASAWAQVGTPGWLDSLRSAVPAAALDALVALVTGPFAAAGIAAAHDGSALTVTLTPAGAAGAIAVRVGWDSAGAVAAVELQELVLADAPVALSGSLGFAGGSLACAFGAAVMQLPDLPIELEPALTASLAPGGGLQVLLLPFGPSTANDLAVELAPAPGLQPASPNLTRLVTQWVLPALTDAALGELDPLLAQPLWSGGLGAGQLLEDAGVLVARPSPRPGQPALRLDSALDPGSLPLRMLQAASSLSVQATPTLSLAVVADPVPPATLLGLRLTGFVDVPTGSLDVRALFGGPNGQPTGDSGVTLRLLDVTDPARPSLRPSLHAVGFGIGLAGAEGDPLVDTSGFHLGGLEGYLFFDLDFLGQGGNGAFTASNLGAGLELADLGIPLAIAGSASSGNPVASSIVGGANGGAAQGDGRPVDPRVSFSAYDRDGTLTILVGGAPRIVVPLHRSFGPLHLEQIEVDVTDTIAAVLFDGGITIAALQADVIDLGVDIPLHTLLHPDTWSLDLRGLAVSLDEPGVSIAGGLVKNDRPPIEYDGMLSAHIADLGGISVVGSYARPSDAQGGYTSLFVFAALDITLGGPPYLFVLGLGGGVGINRELHVPGIDGVESFVLVEAIDDDSLANDPLQALMQIGQLMPPRRGAYWIAAGLRFSTFALVTTTAVVFVSLDRGVEVTVLGISRMALPTPDDALASVELALKARYSTTEELLSVQGQLTDNSWLFDRDCQLTGGFAYFMWFKESQFVLTLGGYHNAFQPPDGFPSVPRLGFHWQVTSDIVVKGESYFALTTSCVMAGGRLEAVYDDGSIRAWFEAHADVLVAWDPFSYDASFGISVGVSATIEVCFIGCATIDVDVSIGADLRIQGPPFHGTVTVSYMCISVTIPFGASPSSPPPLSWEEFRAKYLVSGDPAQTACDAAPATGLLPPDPPGAAPSPGTADQPWRVLPEWSFQSSTRLAAASVTDVVTGNPIAAPAVGSLDLAPMGAHYSDVDSAHRLHLDVRRADGSWEPASFTPGSVTTEPLVTQLPEATWYFTDEDSRVAGARTVSAVTGALVTGHPVLPDQGSDIHVALLVRDLVASARPLPLDPGPHVLTVLQGHGASAESLAARTAGAGSAALIGAAAQLLSGPLAAEARAAVGATAAGLAPMSVRALRLGRSSPPEIVPLATGLTMSQVHLPTPPPVARTPEVTPVALEAPRVKAVLGTSSRAAAPAPAVVRTSVAGISGAARLARIAPPAPPTVAGARLVRVPLPGAARPTRVARAARWLRSDELGTPLSSPARAAIASAESALADKGLTVAAGESYVVELPPGGGEVSVGGAAGRVTLLDRGGGVLLDREGTGAWTLAVPPAAAALVVGCLGTGGATEPAAAPGAGGVTAETAPAGAVAATGWSAGNQVVQVASQTLLCRGGWLTLERPAAARRARVTTHLATVRASSAVAGTTGVETRLPPSSAVVAILLDQVDPTAALAGDLAVAAQGVTLSTPPSRVGGGRRLALLYEAVPTKPVPDSVSVSVASSRGWQLAGVVGLPGRAAEWAARWNGSVPEHLVPDGPLTPDGSLTVRWTAAAPGGPQ